MDEIQQMMAAWKARDVARARQTDTLSLLIACGAMDRHLSEAQKQMWKQIHANNTPSLPLDGTLKHSSSNLRRISWPAIRLH